MRLSRLVRQFGSVAELFAEAEPFAKETLDKADALGKLAEDVNKLLAELQASCPHPRLKAAYAEAQDNHARLIGDLLALLSDSGALRSGFDETHYRSRVGEVDGAIGRLRTADAEALEALGALAPALKPVHSRAMAAPEKIGLTVGAILVSPPCLVRWHFEALSEYLNRPSGWQRLIEGVGKVLRAAALDASGSVVPFLGTAEVLCQLSVSQMARDRERIKSANNDISRLYFFTDHLAVLVGGVEAARDNAQRSKEFIVQANRGFDEDCDWLIEVVSAL
jgi:hypothetical protein